MGRQKKQIVMKEPIRLREQVLKNGNRSLYLDIYHNGKRTYKFLKLYLVPEIDAPARIMNANTLAQANAIKEEMILDLTNSMAGIKDKSHKGRMPFCTWMGIYAENAKKNCAESSKRWMDRTVKEVTDYDSETTLANVDKEFLAGFMEHLVGRSAHNTDRKKLTKTTVFLYLSYVRAALNYAVRESVIPKSPFKGITRASLSIKEHKREYLTVEEIKRLIATPCHREDIKGAFLFSCFSGLRIYDIMNLRWKDIVQTATHWQVEIIQYKTGVELFLPLNMNARKWLPEKTGDTVAEDKIFPRLTRNYGQTLGTWMKNAGITKGITFHAGRHREFYKRQIINRLCCSLIKGGNDKETSKLLYSTLFCHFKEPLFGFAKILFSKQKDKYLSTFLLVIHERYLSLEAFLF